MISGGQVCKEKAGERRLRGRFLGRRRGGEGGTEEREEGGAVTSDQ